MSERSGYGFLMAAQGLGAVISAIVMNSRSTAPKALRQNLVFGIFCMAFAIVGFGLSTWMSVSLLAQLFIGVGLMNHMVTTNTLLQLFVTDELRGRVMSIYTLSFIGTAPLGSLTVGYIGEHFSPRTAVMVCAAFSLMCGFLLLTKLKMFAAAQEEIEQTSLIERRIAGLRNSGAVFDNLAVVPKHSKKHKDADAAARAELVRAVPPIDECIKAAEANAALAGFGRSYIKLMVQRAQAELRAAILAGRGAEPRDRAAMIDAVVQAVARAVAQDEPVLRPVVNATGVVLHTNLGRAILAESAIEAVEMAARSAVNLEYDLDSGGRGDRDSIVEDEICALTGAEAATVVNNNAAAVVLALNSLAEGREVIVSRGEMIEIGGSFRLPDVMAKSGATIREVGTTNRTHPSDYADAIGPQTALLLKVHPSNYRVVGFTSEVTLEDLVEIGRARQIDVMEDLGAGALIDLTEYGIPREPIVRERIAAGAAVVTFSGDKLLGGPQAGVIVGRRAAIERIKRNPLKRALRCDKLTLAALSATMRLYLRSGDLAHELPTLRILGRHASEIAAIAPRAREIVAERLGAGYVVEIVDAASQVGSGAMPVEELKSVAHSRDPSGKIRQRDCRDVSARANNRARRRRFVPARFAHDRGSGGLRGEAGN